LSLSAGALAAAGCSSQTSNLKMTSINKKQCFDQTFTEAYLSKSDTGDTDVVLIADPQPTQPEDLHKPLSPEANADVPRQVVHIRIYWKPVTGTKADHPANTNASVHWYMIGTTPEHPSVMEYCGSGLVTVDESDDTATLLVRRAWMKASNHCGSMCDPLGPCLLDGKISAKIDSQEVKSILATLKTDTAPVTEAKADQSTNGQPPKLMIGR
jgi:hypothetical protein